MTCQFEIVRDFDLAASVTCGQVFRWRESHSSVWVGTVGDDAYWVREAGDRYEVASNQGEDAFVKLFRLDHDWRGLAARVGEAGFSETSPYVRTVRSPSVVETLFSFMCTANNNIARIQPMVEALGRRGPVVWRHEGQDFHAFPSLETIAGLQEEDLRRQGFGYRARHIPAAAARLLDSGGHKYLARLAAVPREEAVFELCRLPGVGPKVADCTALHGLGHTDTVPVDTHIWQAAVRDWFPEWKGSAMTPGRYQAVGDRYRLLFGREAGLAQQLVFHRSLADRRSR